MNPWLAVTVTAIVSSAVVGALGLALAVVMILLLGLVPVEGNQAMEFLGKPTLSWQIAAATAAILGGTVFALVFALSARFLALAYGTIDAGLQRVTPNMDDAARMLGATPGVATFAGAAQPVRVQHRSAGL